MVAGVFGDTRALALKTYSVLIKGVHRRMLADATLEQAVAQINGRNQVSVFRAHAKRLKPGATYGALLLEFANIAEANKVCQDGIVWDS